MASSDRSRSPTNRRELPGFPVWSGRMGASVRMFLPQSAPQMWRSPSGPYMNTRNMHSPTGAASQLATSCLPCISSSPTDGHQSVCSTSIRQPIHSVDSIFHNSCHSSTMSSFTAIPSTEPSRFHTTGFRSFALAQPHRALATPWVMQPEFTVLI